MRFYERHFEVDYRRLLDGAVDREAMTFIADDAKNTAKSVGGVFVTADGNSVDTHLDDRIIIATGLGHIAEVEDIGFLDVELV